MSKPLPKVPVAYNFGAVRTDRNDRYVAQGDLVSLVNWRRTVEGRLQKRLGNDRTTIDTFVGGTYAGPTRDVTPSSAVILRDSSDQIWAKGPDGKGYFKGTELRAHPTFRRIENLADATTANKPAIARRSNGDIFHFALGVGDGFQVTVLGSDGSVKHRPAVKSAAGIVAYSVAVDASDNVWIAYLSENDPDSITTHQFTATGAIGITNSITVASHEFTDIRLRLLGNSELAVVALSLTTSGADRVVKNWHAYLNSSGGAKVSPAAVSTSYTSGETATTPECANGLSIADSTADATSWYYSFWRTKDDGDVQLVRCKVALADLTVTSTVELDAITPAAAPTDEVYIGQSTGYVVANNDEYFFGSVLHMHSLFGPDDVRDSVTRRYAYNGSVVAESRLGGSAYVAGDVFTVGSVRYLLTGFDDMQDLRFLGAQRGYFIRSATTGQIVTEMLSGLGGQVCFAGGADETGRSIMEVFSGHTVAPVVAGNTALIPLLQAGSTAFTHEPVLATVDFAATYHSLAPNVIPGGVPKTVSPQDPVTELAPIHYPYGDLAIVGNGTAGPTHSENLAAYLYCTINAVGEVTRSAPRTTQELVFEEYTVPDPLYTLRIPTLRHAIGPTWIELYLSENQDGGGADTSLYLAKRFPNDPTVDSVDVAVEPGVFQAGSGELLETTNLATRLENASVPPARLACIWRDRLWLAGTPEDDVLYSQEKRPGRGYEFNESLSVVWQDGTGPIRAICPLSFDALVVWRRDAIGLVTGPGPGPAGPNNFVVQTIAYDKGCTNPKSVVLGPAGVYFLDAASNRPHVISGGVVGEIGQGFESYLAQVPVAALHDVAQSVIRWYCSSGKQLKLDYRRPAEGQPAGQWLEDSNSNLPAAVGAVVIAGAAVMVEAGTTLLARSWQAGAGFTDNGTAVLKDLVAARVAPVGLLGEFDLDEFQMSSTRLGGDSAYTYTLTGDQGVDEPHVDAASNTADVQFRSAIFRTREFRLRIQETSATGEGRSFDGLALVVRPYGKFQNPYRRIA